MSNVTVVRGLKANDPPEEVRTEEGKPTAQEPISKAKRTRKKEKTKLEALHLTVGRLSEELKNRNESAENNAIAIAALKKEVQETKSQLVEFAKEKEENDELPIQLAESLSNICSELEEKEIGLKNVAKRGIIDIYLQPMVEKKKGLQTDQQVVATAIKNLEENLEAATKKFGKFGERKSDDDDLLQAAQAVQGLQQELGPLFQLKQSQERNILILKDAIESASAILIDLDFASVGKNECSENTELKYLIELIRFTLLAVILRLEEALDLCSHLTIGRFGKAKVTTELLKKYGEETDGDLRKTLPKDADKRATSLLAIFRSPAALKDPCFDDSYRLEKLQETNCTSLYSETMKAISIVCRMADLVDKYAAKLV